MTNTRRDLLAIMGLAPAAALINTEAVAPQYPYRTEGVINRVADSLVKLADAIRSGDVDIVNLVVTSEISPDTFLDHELRLRVSVKDKPEPIV
jgi:hypothetical protein